MFSQNFLSKARLKKNFLIGNHYTAIYGPVRSECSSCRGDRSTVFPFYQRLVRLITPFDVWGLPPQADIDPKEDIPDYIYSEEEISRKKSIVPDHDLTHAMTVSVSALSSLFFIN